MKIKEITQRRPDDLCLVCGAPADLVGIFTPEDPAKWGAPRGKSRFLRYCLCSKCQGQPGTPDRVEKILWVELVSGDVIYKGELHAQ